MNRKEWQQLDRARKLLKLGEKATLDEIKRAYHRLCKQYHPDVVGEGEGNEEQMYQLTAAYELLMRYCKEYRFPLKAGDNDIYDAEDWWMDRFGNNPMWGMKRKNR